MRARNLKPAIFKNEALAKLGPWHYILFTGLWCLADRKGRMEDRPERIEAEIFPFKFQQVNVNQMLDDLMNCDQHFIIRYTKGSDKFIQVINFENHQFPHHREKETTIPSPGKALGQTRESPIQAHLNPDVLNPESPILNPDIPKDAFEILWNKQPRREGKKAAERHFDASVKTFQDWLDIQNALDNYLDQLRINRTELKFTKQAATWFNNWSDYVNYKVVESITPKAPAVPPKPKEIEIEPTDAERAEAIAALQAIKATLKKSHAMPMPTDMELEREKEMMS